MHDLVCNYISLSDFGFIQRCIDCDSSLKTLDIIFLIFDSLLFCSLFDYSGAWNVMGHLILAILDLAAQMVLVLMLTLSLLLVPLFLEAFVRQPLLWLLLLQVLVSLKIPLTGKSSPPPYM